jgi:hypothetical protein
MVTAMELLGFMVLLGVPLGYLALQLRLLRRWRGGWRLAAGAPLPIWLIWVARFAWDTTLDPTSHNLFPFEILIGAAAALLYLAVLAGIRFAAEAMGSGQRRP